MAILRVADTFNSENCEHLKNVGNVDCIVTNHHNVQHTRANLNLITVAVCSFVSHPLLPFPSQHNNIP